METVKDVFTTYRQQLQHLYDLQELEAITLLILNEITGKSNAQLKAFPDTSLTESQSQQLTSLLQKLLTGMPVQYATGYTEFYGLSFKVAPGVLIPRPETEELVDWVLNNSNTVTTGLYTNVIDIGTGSGCIAIALKKNLPAEVNVSAVDISAAALQIASENAAINKVTINFIEADILNENFYAKLNNTSFNVIISNPPYVTLTDKQQMHSRVTDFEPHTALFVPEDDPLIFYKAITDFALQHLTENGILFLEINESYGNETVEMMTYKGFKNIELKQDMYGKNRMIMAKR